ncbi:mitochondrial metalloendopeptidase OMA1-like [Rutidosis leptorrhynchoides]|uniref:mitochondrial metalloendopeptidase OMA1-like n=1 Tax=Rutidosis leptorrhynchoides TaxID=125765 RepID=UPI003A9A4A3D
MASYRILKLGFNAISRCFASKITAPKTLIRNPPSIINHNHHQISKFSNYAVSRVPKNSSFSAVIGNTNSTFRFFGSSYRNYSVASRQNKHYNHRDFKRWFDNPRNVLIAVLVGSGIGYTVIFGTVETIPYTKRKHLIIMTINVEKKIGESEFKKIKDSYKRKIVPETHPDSVRVRMITKDIIEALKRGLKKEQVWTDLNYASEGGPALESKGEKAAIEFPEETNAGDLCIGKDEVLDDTWVDQSMKKGEKEGVKSDTTHLEGLEWEVLVVNDKEVNAFCLPGGKIVVFSGLLKHFTTNEEIATIIAHEVAHAVARHSAEQFTKNIWFTIGKIILLQYYETDLVNLMSKLLLDLPFSRRMEIEADYIGLLLMASAGYDPRVAPKVFEKLGKIAGDSALQNYLSTHPSGKKRSKLLSEAKVMQEAVSFYHAAKAGQKVDGFIL